MKLSFLGQILSNIGNCIWFNLITEKSVKGLGSGVVGSRCSDTVRTLFLHMPQLSFPLWSWLHSQASSPQPGARVAALCSLCSLGQEKEDLFPHDFRESSGQSFNWLGLVVLPSMSQSLWPRLGCSDWPFLGPVLLPPHQPGCRVSPSLVG